MPVWRLRKGGRQMSDETMGEYWRDVAPAMKQESQERRARNRASSADMLAQAGIAFESKNNGVHLIVDAGNHLVDFWSGTGKWATRGYRFALVSRGVHGLIKHIKKGNP